MKVAAGEISEKTRVNVSIPILVTVVGVVAGLGTANAIAQFRLSEAERKIEKVETRSVSDNERLIRVEEGQRQIAGDLADIKESLRDLAGRARGRSSNKP